MTPESETHRPILGPHYRIGDIWPRRAGGLPPGQRTVRAMPRFSARPTRPPPATPEHPVLLIEGEVGTETELGLEHLEQVSRVEVEADFHCVTTWTMRGLRWSGWRLIDVWRQLILPAARPHAQASHLRAIGLDGYFAVLQVEDALDPGVLIVDRLEDEPLDPIHGAPLRLLSPKQYGYKSVKHLCGLAVHTSEPERLGKRIEHIRARVDLEERHETLSGRLLRWPYRLLVIPTALAGRRSARKPPEAS